MSIERLAVIVEHGFEARSLGLPYFVGFLKMRIHVVHKQGWENTAINTEEHKTSRQRLQAGSTSSRQNIYHTGISQQIDACVLLFLEGLIVLEFYGIRR